MIRRLFLALFGLAAPVTRSGAAQTPSTSGAGGLASDLERISVWVKTNAPDQWPLYAPAATAAQIDEAERQIGVKFPDDLRMLYSIANGATEQSPALVYAFGLMTLDEMVDSYQFLRGEFPDGKNVEHPDHAPMDVPPGIRPVWWSPKWIPFMYNGGGDYISVDMDPAPGGVRGQVISYYHDETFRTLDASSISQLFARIADKLESGEYRLDEGMIGD